MNILEAIAIEVPCTACGDRYLISLEKIMLGEHMLHDGCPVPMQFSTECPPLYYAHLMDPHLIDELQRIWRQLEEYANAAGGKLLLREIQGRG